MSVCECCERERQPDEAEFVVSREGDSFCPECNASLMAELQRMIAKLPARIGLCPQCAEEFYYPLNDGEGLVCPTSGCGLDMIVYERVDDRVRLEADLAALREAAQAVVEEGCREELGKPTFDKCWKPAEFVLWGKLIPPEGLGPRCYEHAAKHVGDRALGDPSWAIIDLRPLRAVLASADSEEER